jgi:hypothetical protein
MQYLMKEFTSNYRILYYIILGGIPMHMNKSTISANTLFHFTSKLDYITNILTNEFTPRYCMESFGYLNEENNLLEIALPMVCFCDIPLSQIRNHIKNYGGYAIGLLKEWGISNGINPVMYSLPDSLSTQINYIYSNK